MPVALPRASTFFVADLATRWMAGTMPRHDDHG